MAEYNGSGAANVVTVRKLKYAMDSLVDKLYPVGSIYMSVNSTNPGNVFGGTWQRIQGRFLVGAGTYIYGTQSRTYDAGATGGQVQHVLDGSEIPAHVHSIPALSGSTNTTGAHVHNQIITAGNGSSGTIKRLDYSGEASGKGATYEQGCTTQSSGNHSHTVTTKASTTGSAGKGAPFDLLPPYLAVYIWKRTA